jgi:hypothetical protein
MRPFRSSPCAISDRICAAASSVTCGFSTLLPTLSRSAYTSSSVGRVFGVGGVEIEQYVLALGDVARLECAHAAAAGEHRQFLLAHREQDVLVQDEGDRDVVRLVVRVEEEIRMQVDLAVVLDVKRALASRSVRPSGSGSSRPKNSPTNCACRRMAPADPPRSA